MCDLTWNWIDINHIHLLDLLFLALPHAMGLLSTLVVPCRFVSSRHHTVSHAIIIVLYML